MARFLWAIHYADVEGVLLHSNVMQSLCIHVLSCYIFMTHRLFGLNSLLLNVIDITISSSYIIYNYAHSALPASRHLNISGSIIPLMFQMLLCLFVKIM